MSIGQCCSVQPCQEETFSIKKSTTLVTRVWTCQDTGSGGQELLNWGGFCCFIYKTTKMTKIQVGGFSHILRIVGNPVDTKDVFPC